MAGSPPHLITVQVSQRESGWFVASSEDCPGLFLFDPSRERVVELIAEGIEVHYLARDQIKVKAIRLSRPQEAAGDSESQIPFAVIPAEATHLSQSA